MSQTVVRRFALLSPAQLLRLKTALKLSLSEEMLAYCARYYKDVARRDPTEDELLLLSALAVEQELLPDADGIYELSTADKEIARTYADAIKKRKLHAQDTSYPPTLTEFSTLAARELCRVGVPLPQARAHAHYAPDGLLEDGGATLTTTDGRVRLRSDAPPAAGDLLVLLSPTTSNCSEFFSPVPIKASHRLGEVGLLCHLISSYGGATVELSAFPRKASFSLQTVLAGTDYRGCYVLCIDAKDLQPLLQFLKKTGINAFPFARLTEDGTVTLRLPDAPAISFRTRFLRALFRRKKHAVTLEDNSAPLSEIAHAPVSPDTAAYLDRPFSRKGGTVAFFEGISCTATSASLTSAPFRSAIYTALVPILRQAALGAPTELQSLSATLTYPDAGACLSALLALYRVQTELALPAHEINLIRESNQFPTLSVFSYSDTYPHSTRLSSVGATVYYLPIAEDETGLPDFADLRKAMALLSDLSDSHLIRAAYVSLNESADSALRSMSTPLKFIPEEGYSDACSESPTLAVLIESDVSLPFPAIARTVAGEPLERVPLPPVTPPRDSMILSDRPELVLIAREGDEDARMLSHMLSARGARVHRFKDVDGPILPLARATLGAHALILCRDTDLPNDEVFGFAMDTMLRAGGSVIALYASDNATVLSLPDGIPEDILETLLINS